ncbi:MAG: NAD(+) diphosphatase [Polyangiaceae bacterium]
MLQSVVKAFTRAGELRQDDADLANRLAEASSLVIPMWRNRNLIATGRPTKPALLTVGEMGDLLGLGGAVVFLGLIEGVACFAYDLPPDREMNDEPALAERGDFNDLRMVGSLLKTHDAELLAYARGMLQWHRHHRFCARCGGETRSKQGGHVRLCLGCEKRHFPRTDPAIMVLVVHEDTCLLARQPTFPDGMFSVLAGFVEPGESIEDAVAREVREEVGLDVTDVCYAKSQPWPFPSSLMLGFSAQTEQPNVVLDREELEDARWFSRDDLRTGEIVFPPPFSLANHLITRFIGSG